MGPSSTASRYCNATNGGVDFIGGRYSGSTADAAAAQCEAQVCRGLPFVPNEVCRCDCGAEHSDAVTGTWVGTETLTLTNVSTGQESATSTALTLVIEHMGYNAVGLHGLCAQGGSPSQGTDSVAVNLVGSSLQLANTGACLSELGGCAVTYFVSVFSGAVNGTTMTGRAQGNVAPNNGAPDCPTPTFVFDFQVTRQ